MRLEGKTALVTGGGSGFGAGIARRFAEEGARVLVVDIDAGRAAAVAGAIDAARQGAARAQVGDVSRRADAEAMVRAARSMPGGGSTSSSTTPASRIATGRCWR